MESNPSQVNKGVIIIEDEDSDLIKHNIKYIDKNNINIDRVPYLEVWKEKAIYILMALSGYNNSFELYINIPNDVIRLISYLYLTILKTINIKSIHLKNICPCDESPCLVEWFDYYSSSNPPSYQETGLELFHCSGLFTEKKCHFIGTDGVITSSNSNRYVGRDGFFFFFDWLFNHLFLILLVFRYSNNNVIIILCIACIRRLFFFIINMIMKVSNIFCRYNFVVLY